MTIADLKKYVDEVYAKDPNCKTPIVVCDGWLRFGEFIEDEEASEDNDWSPDGHWDIGERIIVLPEEAKRWE